MQNHSILISDFKIKIRKKNKENGTNAEALGTGH